MSRSDKRLISLDTNLLNSVFRSHKAKLATQHSAVGQQCSSCQINELDPAGEFIVVSALLNSYNVIKALLNHQEKVLYC